MEWSNRFNGGRPAAWWDRVFATKPRPAGRQNAGACFCCIEGCEASSAVGEATIYEILPQVARSLRMPGQVPVHNLCAFGFETDLLRRIQRHEPFSPAHLMAYRNAEAKAARAAKPVRRVAVRLA